MKKLSLLPLILAASVHSAFALTASDNASNYTTPTWIDTSNGGSGFLAWSLNNNDNGSTVFGGNFIGSSTDGAGNINTGTNQSFGLFANPGGAFSTATRSFSSALNTNDQFSFDFAVNFDNGNKGFNIKTAGDSIFNFNVGNGASVSSANATLVAGSGAGYDYGGGDALLQAVLTVISPTSLTYQISRTSSQGFQGVLFSGSVTGITASIDNFEFYISDTDNGSDANNLYFNSLSVSEVPEPSSYALLLGVFSMLWMARRR